MKKLVLTSACALAITGAAFAQGTLNWSTISFASMTAQTNSTAYSPLLPSSGTPVGGAVGNAATSVGFYYELLYTSYSGSQATIGNLASLLSWNDAGLWATNQNTAGRLNPGNPTTAATVPWATGTTDSIVMVGWSANLGTTWGVVSNELASGSYIGVLAGQNGFLGISTTGYIASGGANPGINPFATAANNNGLPIFSLNTPLYLLPVPEPATLALAGLGGLSLLLFRRRK